MQLSKNSSAEHLPTLVHSSISGIGIRPERFSEQGALPFAMPANRNHIPKTKHIYIEYRRDERKVLYHRNSTMQTGRYEGPSRVMTTYDSSPVETSIIVNKRTSQEPRFSIIMPAHNAEDTIGRAIASVLAQTRKDWELIIVDDGSSDGTSQQALQTAANDPRIAVLRQKNTGAGQARNNAVSRAQGEYVCLLDADDEMSPSYLERMTALTDSRPDCALFSGNAWCVNPSGSAALWRSGPKFSTERSFSLSELLQGNHIFIMATIRSDVYRAMGGMSPSLSRCEDYDLWLRILAAGHRHLFTPEVLGMYHRQPTSLSTNLLLEATSIVQIMNSLIALNELTVRDRRIARRHIRAASARADLERRRLEADYTGSRILALRSVTAYRRPTLRIVGTALALCSPHRYFRLVSQRRSAQLAQLYGHCANRHDTRSRNSRTHTDSCS